MQPTPELIDAIYRERVLRARRTPPGRKFLEGLEMFETVISRMTSGIRADFPDADEERVREILHERISKLRRIAEHGRYRPYRGAEAGS
jgi:hypothetical protein